MNEKGIFQILFWYEALLNVLLCIIYDPAVHISVFIHGSGSSLSSCWVSRHSCMCCWHGYLRTS